MSNILKRDAPRPSKTQVVEIPEWGGAVVVRGLPLRLLFAAKANGASDESGIRERDLGVQSILACVFDEDGEPFFQTSEEIESIDLPIFTRLQSAIAALSTSDPAAIAKN